MTETSASQLHAPAHVESSIVLFFNVAAALGVRPTPPARILDFGCGRGETVAWLLARGFAAEGVDTMPYWEELSPQHRNEALEEHLHLAAREPYRLPFPDGSFDFAMSEQVFEHVMDYGAVFRELRRVLRPQAISIHLFPNRWRPVENHVKVPLGTVIRNRPWLAAWALLGIRNEFQAGLGWREVTERNFTYLRDSTTYPTNRHIRQVAAESGVQVRFVPDLYVAHHPGRYGRLMRNILASAPRLLHRPTVSLFSAVTQRLMIVAPAAQAL